MNAETQTEYQSDAVSTKYTPYLALTGEICGVFWEIILIKLNALQRHGTAFIKIDDEFAGKISPTLYRAETQATYQITNKFEECTHSHICLFINMSNLHPQNLPFSNHGPPRFTESRH